MPKLESEEVVKQEDSLSCYLVPAKENLSSFAQTVESACLKSQKEERLTFSIHNSDPDSNKISFAQQEICIQPEKSESSVIQQESSLMPEEPPIPYSEDRLLTMSSEDSVAHKTLASLNSQICQNSPKKPEIYKASLEEDDLVVCKRDDLESVRRSHLYTINLDIQEDSIMEQVKSGEEVSEGKFPNISDISHKTTEYFDSDSKPARNDGEVTSRFGKKSKIFQLEEPEKTKSEIVLENSNCHTITNTNESIELCPIKSFDSCTTKKSINKGKKGILSNFEHRKASASHTTSDLNLTEEKLDFSNYYQQKKKQRQIPSKSSKSGLFEKSLDSAVYENMDKKKNLVIKTCKSKEKKRYISPKPRIVTNGKQLKRRKSPLVSKIQNKPSRNKAQLVIHRHKSPFRILSTNEDHNSSLMSYSKFKDKLRKSSTSQSRVLNRNKSSSRIPYKTTNPKKPNINSTSIDLYTSLNGRKKKYHKTESGEAIRSIASSLRDRMKSNKSPTKYAKYSGNENDISISCKIPTGSRITDASFGMRSNRRVGNYKLKTSFGGTRNESEGRRKDHKFRKVKGRIY